MQASLRLLGKKKKYIYTNDTVYNGVQVVLEKWK